MADADIQFNANSIVFKDGDVTCEQALSCQSLSVNGVTVNAGVGDFDQLTVGGSSKQGKVSVFDSSDRKRMELDASNGKTLWRLTTGVATIDISSGGILVKDNSGATKITINYGGITMVAGDISLGANCDVKIEGKSLAELFDRVQALENA